jgi:hypothetical protein
MLAETLGRPAGTPQRRDAMYAVQVDGRYITHVDASGAYTTSETGLRHRFDAVGLGVLLTRFGGAWVKMGTEVLIDSM